MNPDPIFERIRRYMIQEFEVAPEAISPESDLFDDLNLDSIDILDLVAVLEGEVGQEIPEEQLANLRRIKDVMAFVKQAAGAGA